MTEYNSLLKGRLTGTQRRKLVQLLDMLYTPAELAEILGFGRRQFYRVYVPAGCPHEREGNGHLWINGAVFRKWYFEAYPKITVAENEVYCLSCKKIVPISDSELKQKGRYLYQSITCSNCGRRVSKAVSNKRENHDQPQKQAAC